MPSHSLNYKKPTPGSARDVAEAASASFSLLLIVPASKAVPGLGRRGAAENSPEELLGSAQAAGAARKGEAAQKRK